MKKLLLYLLPFILIIGVFCLSTILTEDKVVFVSTTERFSDEPIKTSAETESLTEETTDSSFTITLSFVGDCLCATDERTSYTNCFEEVADREDPSYFLEKVNHLFLEDDFTIADCENVFSDDDTLSTRDKGQYADPNIEAYWFKYKASGANILKVGGVDMVSIDNNHINDYGEQGRLDTQKALDDAQLLWGEAGKIVYYKKNNYKIGVVCFSMYNNSMAQTAMEYLEEAKEKSDYQILYFHGGAEAVHVPEDWKVQACHDFIDAGADLIMGDHPHVLQPREIYNEKTIIYSLGNFIFGGNRHPENRTIIYQHTLTIDSDNSLENEEGNIIPCYVYTGDTNNWQPDIIEDQEIKQKVLDFMDGKISSPL